jgi:hypothetical protein
LQVAPGLTARIKVSFRTAEANVLHDKLLIVYGDNCEFKLSVPLNAYPPRAVISYNSVVNFGFVVHQSQSVKTVKFTNSGAVPGKFTFATPEDGSSLQISPIFSDLAAKGQPGDTTEVTFSFTGVTPGEWRTSIEVNVGEHDPPGTMSLSASVVTESLQLMLAGQDGPVSNISFGSLYFGQQRRVTSMLLNNSPNPAHFRIVYSEGKDPDSVLDDDDDVKDNKLQSLHQSVSDLLILPQEGVLAPYERIPIELVFQPKEKSRAPVKITYKHEREKEALYKQDFQYRAQIESVGSENVIRVGFSAVAIRACVNISQDIFDFGTVPTYEHRDLFMTLTNKSEELPLSFKIEKAAQFRIQPDQGVLPCNVPVTVMVTFMPRNLGTFSTTVNMQVSDVLNFPLALRGICFSAGSPPVQRKGMSGLPEDFEHKIRHVPEDPIQKFQKKSKFTRASGWKNSELAKDYEGPNAVTNESYEIKNTFTAEQLQKKMANRDLYDDFLVNERNARLNKMKGFDAIAAHSAFSNKVLNHGLPPLVVDIDNRTHMNMEFAEGLNSPRLDLPEPEEELYMVPKGIPGTDAPETKSRSASSMSAAGPEADAASSTAVKAAFATKKAKKSKLKKGPTTQAERRDCESHLSHTELALIHAGPMRVDFGSISLSSITEKTFTVSNGLDHHILLEADFPDEQVAKSFPICQMIPPRCIGEITVVFHCTSTEEFKKTMHYKINGKHHFSFSVCAEVVPISLRMHPERLNFEFHRDDVNFYVKEEVELSNSSNITVDFWWTVENEVFKIEPSSGTVQPFRKFKCEFKYMPDCTQKPFDDEIKLHVKNGPPKKLRVSAHCEEAMFALKKRSLEFGTVCVGFTESRNMTIRNSGRTRGVFAVGELPNTIQVTPTRAILDAGQSLPMTITMTPSTQEDINIGIDFNIRGKAAKSKPLKLQVVAKAIIPDLVIEQDDVDFGGVTLGRHARCLVTIVNKSAVRVNLFLDLTANPEFSMVWPEEWNDKDDCPVTRQSADAVQKGLSLDGVPRADSEASTYSSDDKQEEAFRIVLGGESKLEFNLQYSPIKVAENTFELPIALIGTPGFAGLRRLVTATGLRPKISVAPAAVEFGKKVVLKKNKARRAPYTASFTLTNQEKKDLRWKLDVPRELQVGSDMNSTRATNAAGDESDITWRIEPISGGLLPGQSVVVSVYFAPIEPMDYSYVLPLYLEEKEAQKRRNQEGDHKEPYLTIELAGLGTRPELTFSCTDLLVTLHLIKSYHFIIFVTCITLTFV